MDKIKKLWKEISVFGIVLVAFLGLFIYNKIVYVDYTSISPTTLTEKMKDKDSFIVVVGSSTDTNTTNYQTVMTQFIRKNRSKTLYYCDLSKEADVKKYVKETFNSDDGTIPQTFVIKKGKVSSANSGVLTYYQLDRLFNEKKD